ncbi:MAG: hypothetical protein ACXVHQ_41230, partial [Solirubrobacteraceae bacterium]
FTQVRAMIIDHGPVPCRQNVGKPADMGQLEGGAIAGLVDSGGRAQTFVDDTSAPAVRYSV